MMEQPMVQEQSNEATVLNQILQVGGNMVGWLKFLGIINIIYGALTALTLWGIIIAWLPIWLGVLLLQAGNKINSAKFSQNKVELVQMMDKLRLYFIVQGILIIVMIVVAIVGIVAFGGILFHLFQSGGLETF
ncbi:MAG: hypothetical protein EH225_04975 [Calditrichaeota bacterium]|nr:hypothetical protein [Calditrichota bacterium]RQW05069.1 MAG: hypothetical protein EH225_04975 [Calditrichota bacterium]